MKQDNLEHFVRKNRKGFDVASPNDALWAKIEKQLPAQPTAKVFSIQRFLSIAASVCLLIGMGIAIGLYVAPSANTGALASIAPEYGEIEQFYSNKVNYQLAQLAKYDQNKDPLIQKDLEELDQWLNRLQEDLIDVPKANRAAVIDAIINNYKTKLNVLERLLNSVEQQAPSKEVNTTI